MSLLIVGVGAMGSAMAARLHDRGHDILGIDPFLVPEGAPLTQVGSVPVVHSLTEVRTHTGTPSEVLVFVRSAEQVSDVLQEMDSQPWFDGTPATILSTLKPTDIRALVDRFGSRRAIIEAPVSGGVSGAREGTLTILLSGKPGNWINDSAATVIRFPSYGQPATAKLLNNALGAANVNALAAALKHAEELGLDATQFLDVVRISSGGGWMADHFSDFPVDLLWKDFGLLNDEHAISFPTTTIATDLTLATTTARQRLSPPSGTSERY